MIEPPFRRGTLVALIAGAACLTFSCDAPTIPAPPRILFGQLECEYCRMIITDERFACATLFESSGNGYRTVCYDDVGCLFAHEAEQAGQKIAARFIKDYSTTQWLDAGSAYFVHAETIVSPMGFGIAAAPDNSQAVGLAADHSGRVLTWHELTLRFENGTPPRSFPHNSSVTSIADTPGKGF